VKYDSVIKNHEAYIALLKAAGEDKQLQQLYLVGNGKYNWYNDPPPAFSASSDYINSWRVKPKPRSLWRVEAKEGALIYDATSNKAAAENMLKGLEHYHPGVYHIVEFVEKTS
jgi:hypothetical protein